MVDLKDIKEKLQQVIEELADHYGEIYELRVETKIEQFDIKLAIIDKIYIKSLEETEI
tara:strand:+ start:1147 stop:1320 length:174 start_codon:yes stop_codon:yes gene_type:complete